MIKIIFTILLSAFGTNAAEPIRVRISSVSPQDIEVYGESLSLNGDVQSKKIGGLYFESAKIDLLNVFGNQWRLERNDQLKIVESKFLKIEGRKLRINSFNAPEKVILWPNESGKVDIIAIMEIEDYLEGVLPHEMPAGWPKEALKAQAVAARSYAVTQMDLRKAKPFHVDSTVDDQVFRFNDRNIADALKEKIRDVVRSTRNEVLKGKDGKIIRTYYHADCGGRTEQAHAVWDNGVKNSIVIDEQCALTGHDDWKLNLSLKNIENRLGFKKIKELKPYFRSPSGRVQSVILINDKKEEMILSGQDFRSKIGFSKLKSTLFDILLKDNQVIFKGKGFGHGVGLCQMGSKTFADRGHSYKEILSHYFPDAKLGTL